MKHLIIFLSIFFTGIIFAQPQLPLTQPFNIAPWNYAGTEHVDSIPYTVKDWMLFELRSDLNTVVYTGAGFYAKDGKARDLTGQGHMNYGNITGQYYLVCINKNSLPVMSSVKVNFQNGYIIGGYDFTTDSDKSYGAENAVTFNSVTGKWAFYNGDGNRDGIINILDYKEVYDYLLMSGYYFGDYDNNGVVNVLDYKFVYDNLFKSSQIPIK